MKLPMFVFAACAMLASPAFANLDMAKAKNCMSCHQVDKKLVGPSYKEVATRYEKDKDAAAKMAKKIVDGGQGAWGPVPMPPNANVKPEEALTLSKWILAGAN